MAVRKTKYGTACDQEWEDFQTKESGKFCDQCNKTVIDFINWDRNTIVQYMQQHPKTCGRFKVEQINPAITNTHFRFNPRLFLLGVISSLGISNIASLPVHETIKTIQKPGTVLPNFKDDRDNENITSVRSGNEIVSIPLSDSTVVKAKKTKRTYKRHYLTWHTYVSWKFPFIHKERRIMGCINF